MYCKLFSSLYQGTLRGKSHEILVFTNLLAHCDAHGYVDKHWKAISDEVGLTIEEVKEAITFLEAPDPESRSHDHDGARIIKMDGHRAWGWQVVNYEKYRAIRDEEDRREQNRLAQQRFREKHNPSSAIVSHDKPPSSEGEGEVEGEEFKPAITQKPPSIYGFSTFWELYPKSVAKLTCQKIWKDFKFDKVTADRVLDGLRSQIQSKEWKEEGGKYVPNPEKWLRGGCWEDKVLIGSGPVFVPSSRERSGL